MKIVVKIDGEKIIGNLLETHTGTSVRADHSVGGKGGTAGSTAGGGGGPPQAEGFWSLGTDQPGTETGRPQWRPSLRGLPLGAYVRGALVAWNQKAPNCILYVAAFPIQMLRRDHAECKRTLQPTLWLHRVAGRMLRCPRPFADVLSPPPLHAVVVQRNGAFCLTNHYVAV